MAKDITDRVKDACKHIVKTNDTVRETAKHFGVSKSTIYKDAAERIHRIDAELGREVRKVLDKNKSERHIRGGKATKEKYILESQSTPDKGHN